MCCKECLGQLWKKLFGPKYDFSKWEEVLVDAEGNVGVSGNLKPNVPFALTNDCIRVIKKIMKSKNRPPNFKMVEKFPPFSWETKGHKSL